MRIEKPIKFGDSYFCYKRFHSIIILACVDARDIFTSVNSERPGSVGDSFTYNHSSLKRNRYWRLASCKPFKNYQRTGN